MNLLVETLSCLENNNKREEDIKFVMLLDKWATWENFKEIAKDINYDEGYGRAEISEELFIVGRDFWLERHEYDGSEWWELKSMPKRPKTKAEFTKKDVYDKWQLISAHFVEEMQGSYQETWD